MKYLPMLTCTLVILAAHSVSWALACQPALQLQAGSADEFAQLHAPQEAVAAGSLDYSLLAEAIFHETNSRRLENGLDALEHLAALDRASCVHAEAMVEQGFFAHRNPARPQLETPADRVRRQGLEIGFVAENIGEVFVLEYESGERVYLRQEDGRTLFSDEPGGEPLGLRSYLEVAENLVDGWMSSEGHRRNILAAEPEQFGAGCQLAQTDQPPMPMLTCVQLFFAPLGDFG